MDVTLLVSMLAVALVGIAKGGFGGVGALVGTPVMSLVLPPAQVVGIMLPLLIAIDALALAGYRRSFDRTVLRLALPGAVVGVVAGSVMLARVDADAVRIVIGGFAIAFSVLALAAPVPAPARPRALPAAVFGGLSGFTSTVAHAGGPPIQLYLLRLGFAPVMFAGTSAIFMALVNLLKIMPYALMGQLNLDNLGYSAALLPVAAIAALFGMRLARSLDRRAFSLIVNVVMLGVGGKLIFDGIAGLTGS